MTTHIQLRCNASTSNEIKTSVDQLIDRHRGDVANGWCVRDELDGYDFECNLIDVEFPSIELACDCINSLIKKYPRRFQWGAAWKYETHLWPALDFFEESPTVVMLKEKQILSEQKIRKFAAKVAQHSKS